MLTFNKKKFIFTKSFLFNKIYIVILNFFMYFWHIKNLVLLNKFSKINKI